MSESIHILRPNIVSYMARVRFPGYRKYTCLKKRRTLELAMKDLAKHMSTGKYKRGDVLALEPIDSYYGPILMYETVHHGIGLG